MAEEEMPDAPIRGQKRRQSCVVLEADGVERWQAEGWRENWYADVQANGVAPAPGGYCTADGELADEFQG